MTFEVSAARLCQGKGKWKGTSKGQPRNADPGVPARQRSQPVASPQSSQQRAFDQAHGFAAGDPHGGRRVSRRVDEAEQGSAANKNQLLPYMPDALQIPELKILQAIKPPLPALAHREEVIKNVCNNRITILSGDTGSGKTTQVPQFIIDHPGLVPEGMTVVVTQPRRIACITIAERVAKERGEKLGDSVGYQIRFTNNTSPSTKLIFATTALVLRKLHSDPNFGNIAVLCIDEVHERDAYTEFLLLAVRERLLRGEMDLKVVVMSATLNVDTFVDFFSAVRAAGIAPDPDSKSCVHIKGRMFPVKEHFLEDALEWTGVELPGAGRAQSATVQKVASRLQARGRHYSESTARSLASAGERDVHLDLIKALALLFHNTALKLGDEGKSGILIFLPGWRDLTDMFERLRNQKRFWTMMLHSNLSPEDQQRIFQDAPTGYRKVVLSTNIAETSVTVDDIVFVINSGVMKERVFDAERQVGALQTTPNTWANVIQRKGRAGRTQEGVVVHLFPQWRLEQLRKWPTPEILSKSLEEVVLQILALGLGDPHEVLAHSLSSPSATSVEHAVWLLQEMSLMNEREGCSASEALLPLGRWLAPIPLHPTSAKALLYGAMFGVLLPVCAAVAFLNIKNPFVQPSAGVVVRGGKHVLVKNRMSDHFAFAAAYLGWRARAAVGEGDNFIDEHGLSRETLEMGDNLVRSLLRMMVDEYEYDGDDAAFADDAESGTWSPEAVFDEDERTWLLCKAALSAAFVPQFVRFNCGRLETDSNQEVQCHGSSCNQRYRPMVNPCAAQATVDDWMLYSDCMKLAKINIMETTAVSAPYVLLFSKSLARAPGAHDGRLVEFDGWRGAVAGGAEAVSLVQRIRHSLGEHVRVLVDNQSATRLAADFIEQLVGVLTNGRLALKEVCGTQSPRVGAKEAATLVVNNFQPGSDEEVLRSLFEACGVVEEVDFAQYGQRAWVSMGCREEALLAQQRAAQLSQAHGRPLKIELKVSPAQMPKEDARLAKLQKRQWITQPSPEERRAHVEALRARATSRVGKKPQVAEVPKKKVAAMAGSLAPTLASARPPIAVLAKAKMGGDAAVKKNPNSQALSGLLVHAARLRVQKRQAIQNEDYEEAGELKQREVEVGLRIEEAAAKIRQGGSADERRSLEEAKRRAVEHEDFEEAGRVKKRMRLLEEQGGSGEDGVHQAWSDALAMAQGLGIPEEGPSILEELRRESAAPSTKRAVTTKTSSAAAQPVAAAQSVAAMLNTSSDVSLAQASGATVAAQPASAMPKIMSDESLVREPNSQEADSCSVPGLTTSELLDTTNEDLWQRAWGESWRQANASGIDNQDVLFSEAQRMWTAWMQDRDALSKAKACGSDDAASTEDIGKKPRQSHSGMVQGADTVIHETQTLSRSSRPALSKQPGVHASESQRDTGVAQLLSLVKEACPTDQPLAFMHLQAACPPGTSAAQLIQAMATEPQEFRQSWDGSEFCVLPVSSRCRDWLPVQVDTKPPGFA